MSPLLRSISSLRWRARRSLDLGTCQVWLVTSGVRVSCPVHGVVSAAVPWARHGARFTSEFEDQAAWLATRTDKTSVTELLRIGWRTVGRIIQRVSDEGRRGRDLLSGLRRSGIDEISDKKGHKYVAVVVDHDTGRLVWASEGRTTRKSGNPAEALSLQRSRFALWKNPEDLTKNQQAKLSSIQRTNKGLYRAYLLKEQFRETIRLKGEDGKALLDRWRAWAQRSRLKPFVKVCRAIRRHRAALDAAFDHNLSNARVEGLNTRLRLISRLAFGFHSAQSFIALGMLKLGGLCPPLPGRA